MYSTDLNQILSVETNVGSVHDFKMFKQSRIWKYKFIQNTERQEFDLGFLGAKNYLKKAILPHKNSKNKKLTLIQKKENRELSKIGSKLKILIEKSKFLEFAKKLEGTNKENIIFFGI